MGSPLRKATRVLTVLVGVVAVLACSSNSSSGGGNSSSSCLQQTIDSSNSGCYSCVQSKCASQLSTFESACSDFFSCICPGGTYSATADGSSACTQKQQEPACQSATEAGEQCSNTNCPSQCGNSSTDGGA